MLGFLKANKVASPVPQKPAKTPIAAFGKLPIRADFIKLNVKEREFRELDEWIQEGYSLISRRYNGSDDEQRLSQAGIHHLVFSATDNRRCVLATIGPGGDRSGRWYPFLISAVAGQAYLRQAQAAVPLIYARFLDDSHKVLKQKWGTEPLETLLGQLETIASECDQAQRAQAVEQELGLLRSTNVVVMHELASQFGEPVAFYQAAIELISNVMRRGPARVHWGVRLPIPAGEHGMAGLVFWLRLLDSLLGRSSQANVIWHWGDTAPETDAQEISALPGEVTVFFRRVPASYLPHLFDRQLRDGNVQSLQELLDNPLAPTQRARDLAALEQGTLLDLLSRFVSGGWA